MVLKFGKASFLEPMKAYHFAHNESDVMLAMACDLKHQTNMLRRARNKNHCTWDLYPLPKCCCVFIWNRWHETSLIDPKDHLATEDEQGLKPSNILVVESSTFCKCYFLLLFFVQNWWQDWFRREIVWWRRCLQLHCSLAGTPISNRSIDGSQTRNANP